MKQFGLIHFTTWIVYYCFYVLLFNSQKRTLNVKSP